MSSLSSMDNISDYLLRSAPVLRAEFSSEPLSDSDIIEASSVVSKIDQIISKLSQVRTLLKSRETEIVNSNSTLRLLPTKDVFHSNLIPCPPSSSSKMQPLEKRQNSCQFIPQPAAVYRTDNLFELNSFSALDFGFYPYIITNLSSGLYEPNLNQLFSHSDIRSNSQPSSGFSTLNLSHNLRTESSIILTADTTSTSRNKTTQPVVDMELANDMD
jgi:hypothetical protein